VKSLIWGPGLKVTEISIPPVPLGWVLAKVLTAYLGPLERAVMLGVQPVSSGRILGGLGIVRVIESGVNVEDFALGGVYAVQPHSNYGLLGIDVDGIIAEYAIIPKDSLIPIPRSMLREPFLPLWLEFSYLKEIKEIVTGKEVLIIGCGFGGLVTARYLQNESNIKVGCVSKALFNDIASYGIEIMSIDNIRRKFDVIILAPLSIYSTMKVLRFCAENSTIIIPPTHPKIIIDYGGWPRSVRLFRPNFTNPILGRDPISRVSQKILKKAYVCIDDLNEVATYSRYFGRISIEFKREKES
jgi:hypothetical protein